MPERRPNIVVTVADDQQAGAIGALGSQVETPTLDAMMRGGTAFTRAHHFGSAHGAVCAPSRAMPHSGRSYFNLPKALHDPAALQQLSGAERAADHGLAVGRHGLLGKQNLYEHSVTVPLILTGPGVPEGRRNDALVYQHDLFPTLLEAAGAAAPPACEFSSLWPHLNGNQAERRGSVFSSYANFQPMVKDERYKLIRSFEQGGRGEDRLQLFDLAEDPLETRDLLRDPAHKARVEQLQALLGTWMRRSNDPLSSSS